MRAAPFVAGVGMNNPAARKGQSRSGKHLMGTAWAGFPPAIYSTFCLHVHGSEQPCAEPDFAIKPTPLPKGTSARGPLPQKNMGRLLFRATRKNREPGPPVDQTCGEVTVAQVSPPAASPPASFRCSIQIRTQGCRKGKKEQLCDGFVLKACCPPDPRIATNKKSCSFKDACVLFPR